MPINYSFSIRWHKANLANLAVQADYYWYALSEGDDQLLYIGMCYHQTVQDRLAQRDHICEFFRKLDVGDQLTIWLGELSYWNTTRLTKLMVEDIEGLLIYVNQPLINKQFKASYTRRDDMLIRSIGCPVLLPQVSIKSGRFNPKSKLPADHEGGRYLPRR